MDPLKSKLISLGILSAISLDSLPSLYAKSEFKDVVKYFVDLYKRML